MGLTKQIKYWETISTEQSKTEMSNYSEKMRAKNRSINNQVKAV
jgi:hypothetical protein